MLKKGFVLVHTFASILYCLFVCLTVWFEGTIDVYPYVPAARAYIYKQICILHVSIFISQPLRNIYIESKQPRIWKNFWDRYGALRKRADSGMAHCSLSHVTDYRSPERLRTEVQTSRGLDPRPSGCESGAQQTVRSRRPKQSLFLGEYMFNHEHAYKTGWIDYSCLTTYRSRLCARIIKVDEHKTSIHGSIDPRTFSSWWRVLFMRQLLPSDKSMPYSKHW